MRRILYLFHSFALLQVCISITNSSDAQIDGILTITTEFVGYVGDPNGRGTVSLVISCLLTLILCVWSALHLNVPHQAETTLQCLLVNVRWIITGVYAPELVVFTAWRQWSSAKILSSLVKNMETKQTVAESTIKSLRRHPWTIAHNFFASTGGFVFEIDEEDKEPLLPAGCPQRFALTARGMALLAKCDLLPDISEAEIQTRAKQMTLPRPWCSSKPRGCLSRSLGG